MAMIFQAIFPECVRVGTIVRIEGSVNPNPVVFNMILSCEGGDEALHCSFRFHELQVVRNHYTAQPSGWGEEEREGGWPLQPLEDFEIQMEVEEQHIRITINGKHFANFVHRLPFCDISQVKGMGDVVISSLTFENAPIPELDPRNAIMFPNGN